MSYQAIVSSIKVSKHPNADRLQLGLVHDHQVVVGIDVKDGDLGVFFPTDGELSDAMCVANDLYNESAATMLGLNDFIARVARGDARFGFFSDKRRVRAQSFRQVKSDGFWIELDKLAWTGYDLGLLKDGDTFTELNGQVVCQKYYTPATRRAMERAKAAGKVHRAVRRLVFPKHIDTAQFRYQAGLIPAGALITITEKLHGTSGRRGHIPEFVRPSKLKSFLRKVADWVVGDVPEWILRYAHVDGSRNVTLNKQTMAEEKAGYYGTNDFRYRMTEGVTLHKGEMLYFELVGYVNDQTTIMQSQPVDDKATKKQYGAVMNYTYGCAPGDCRLYVYRMTRVNEDGVEVDLSWAQVKQRAEQLGLQTVPELAQFLYKGDIDGLKTFVDELMEGPSTLDARHIREGVVVRAESPNGTQFMKSKSWIFGVLEGYIKDQEDAVDLEEAA